MLSRLCSVSFPGLSRSVVWSASFHVLAPLAVVFVAFVTVLCVLCVSGQYAQFTVSMVPSTTNKAIIELGAYSNSLYFQGDCGSSQVELCKYTAGAVSYAAYIDEGGGTNGAPRCVSVYMCRVRLCA